MAPRKTVFTDPSDANAERTPTDNEMKFFKAMMENFNTKPDIHWDKVAEAMTLKDAKCAKERYRQMCVKHGWNKSATASPASARKSTDAAMAPSTPTKAGKVTKRAGKVGSKKAPPKKAQDEEDDAELELEDATVKPEEVVEEGAFDDAV